MSGDDSDMVSLVDSPRERPPRPEEDYPQRPRISQQRVQAAPLSVEMAAADLSLDKAPGFKERAGDVFVSWISDQSRRRRAIVGSTIAVVVLAVCVFVAVFVTMDSEPVDTASYLDHQDYATGVVWRAHAAELAAARDTEHEPCSSMYRHTCGKMLAQVPPDQSVGAFIEMRESIEDSLEQIVVDGWPIIGSWFDACMNRTARQSTGLVPLLDMLSAINAVVDSPTFTVALAALHIGGVDALYAVGVAEDGLNTNINALYIDAAPVPSYGSNSSSYRAAIARLIGPTAADQALDVEFNQLYPYTMTTAQKRIFDSTYNVVTDPSSISPSGLFVWSTYLQLVLEDRPVPPGAPTILVQPQYAAQVERVLLAAQRSGSWASLRSYLIYRLVLTFAEAVPMSIPDSDDALAVECLDSVEESLGEILGHYYVSKNFPLSSKDGVNEIVKNCIQAFSARLMQIDWMDEPTRAEALAKLAAIHPMIGYPDKWNDDLPPFQIDEGDHLGNVVRAYESASRANMRSLFSAPDSKHWLMTAYTVNAYYSRETIVFPAGILQGPFYNPQAPDEINYGALGAVVGHEITHAFDDQGSEYDSKGIRRDWWSANSSQAFWDRAECVIDLYDSFSGVNGDHIDGMTTLGENLADMGGLAIALRAYEFAFAARFPKKAQQDVYSQSIKDLFGMSRHRLFYSAYAYSWCTKLPATTAAYLLKNDVHSPARWRVDGTTSQSASFAHSFACTDRDTTAMCQVW